MVEARWVAVVKQRQKPSGSLRKKMVAARQNTILEAEAKHKAEVEVEQGCGLPSKQKGWVEGEHTACDHYVTWGFECKVSQFVFYLISPAIFLM